VAPGGSWEFEGRILLECGWQVCSYWGAEEKKVDGEAV
jgi:hypothetical protein